VNWTHTHRRLQQCRWRELGFLRNYLREIEDSNITIRYDSGHTAVNLCRELYRSKAPFSKDIRFPDGVDYVNLDGAVRPWLMQLKNATLLADIRAETVGDGSLDEYDVRMMRQDQRQYQVAMRNIAKAAFAVLPEEAAENGVYDRGTFEDIFDLRWGEPSPDEESQDDEEDEEVNVDDI